MNKQVEQPALVADVQSLQTQSVKKTRENADAGRSSRQPEQGSILSHLGYGFGMLIIMGVPPFIPGVTVRGLVIAYMVAVLVIYSVVCVMGIIKALRPVKTTRTGRRMN